MSIVRITASPALAAEKPKRERAAAVRERVRPVSAPDAADADRERSLQDELSASEEHLPTALADTEGPDPQQVVADLNRLGDGVSTLLQPLSPRVRELAGAGGVDEEA